MYQRQKFDEDTKKLNKIPNENRASSIKFDGANYFIQIRDNGSLGFISRRESVKGGFPEKTNRLPHLADIKIPDYKGYVLNAELIHTGFDKNNIESHPMISGILNSLPERAKIQQELYGPVRVVLHDVIEPKISTFKEKMEVMKAVEKAIGKPDLVFSPEFKIGEEGLNELIKHTKEVGREGVIVTDLTKPEADNVRIKIKHKKTANLRIKSILQEVDIKGNPKESTGAFVVEDSNGREVANVGTGLTRELRIQSWRNPRSFIGKVIQVEYMDVARNRLRSPVYNGDADGSVDKFEDL